MAIQLRYQAPAASIATVSQQAGEGQYAQAQDQLALQQAALDQRAQQMQLQRDLAALRDLQQRRSLGAQMYQFNAQRGDRAAMGQAELQQRAYLAELQQQGYADMRDSEQALQTERLQADQQKQLTAEQNRIKQFYLDQEFNAGMSAAQSINKQWPGMSEAQRQQAITGWENRYGQTMGQFPFIGEQQGGDDAEFQAARDESTRVFGDDSEMAARDWLETPADKRTEYRMKKQELEVDRTQVQQQAELQRWMKEQEQQQKAAAAAQSLNMDYLNESQKISFEAYKQNMEMMSSRVKSLQDAKVAESGFLTTAMAEENDKGVAASQSRIADLDKQIDAAMQQFTAFVSSQAPGMPQQGGGQQGTETNPIRISSDEEYEKLPDGAVYIGPDNVKRRK